MSAKPKVPPATLLTTNIEKLGLHQKKPRTLVVRSDALFFLGAGDVIKRHIPLGLLLGVSKREKGQKMRIEVRGEHDVVILVPPTVQRSMIEVEIDRIFEAIKKAANALCIVWSIAFGSDPLPIDIAGCNLKKQPSYCAPVRRLQVRSSVSKSPMATGPVTINSWDAVVPNPLPVVPETKMSLTMAAALKDQKVVMMGAVLTHGFGSDLDGASNVTRMLAFTTYKVLLCDVETGRELLQCSLYSLICIEVQAKQRVNLQFRDELVRNLCFSFPAPAGRGLSNVVHDYSVVAGTIQSILLREGVFLDTKQVDIPEPPSPTVAPSPPQTPPRLSADQAAADTTPVGKSGFPPSPLMNDDKLKAEIPDYGVFVGEVARKFVTPQTLLVRDVLRLTSRGVWEPRVVILTSTCHLLVSDPKQSVRRSIAFTEITEMKLLSHWEGTALVVYVKNEHALIIKASPRSQDSLRVSHIATIIHNCFAGIPFSKITSESDSKLKDLVTRDKTVLLKKSKDYETQNTPQKKLASFRQTGSASPLSSVRTDRSSPSGSAVRADRSEFPEIPYVESSTSSPGSKRQVSWKQSDLKMTEMDPEGRERVRVHLLSLYKQLNPAEIGKADTLINNPVTEAYLLKLIYDKYKVDPATAEAIRNRAYEEYERSRNAKAAAAQPQSTPAPLHQYTDKTMPPNVVPPDVTPVDLSQQQAAARTASVPPTAPPTGRSAQPTSQLFSAPQAQNAAASGQPSATIPLDVTPVDFSQQQAAARTASVPPVGTAQETPPRPKFASAPPDAAQLPLSPLPPSPREKKVVDFAPEEQERLRMHLAALYTQFSPADIGKAEKLLTSTVTEGYLLKKIYDKYKVDPATAEAIRNRAYEEYEHSRNAKAAAAQPQSTPTPLHQYTDKTMPPNVVPPDVTPVDLSQQQAAARTASVPPTAPPTGRSAQPTSQLFSAPQAQNAAASGQPSAATPLDVTPVDFSQQQAAARTASVPPASHAPQVENAAASAPPIPPPAVPKPQLPPAVSTVPAAAPREEQPSAAIPPDVIPVDLSQQQAAARTASVPPTAPPAGRSAQPTSQLFSAPQAQNAAASGQPSAATPLDVTPVDFSQQQAAARTASVPPVGTAQETPSRPKFASAPPDAAQLPLPPSEAPATTPREDPVGQPSVSQSLTSHPTPKERSTSPSVSPIPNQLAVASPLGSLFERTIPCSHLMLNPPPLGDAFLTFRFKSGKDVFTLYATTGLLQNLLAQQRPTPPNSSQDVFLCVCFSGPSMIHVPVPAAIAALRSAAAAHWLQRELVAVRCSDYQWVDLPCEQFVVALESGVRPRTQADAEFKRRMIEDDSI